MGLDKKVFLFKLFLFCRKFGQHPSDNHDNSFFLQSTPMITQEQSVDSKQNVEVPARKGGQEHAWGIQMCRKKGHHKV